LIDALTSGPLVLVGASMGGWIMLHLALARPQRVSGLIGLGSAPDFPDQMLERRFSDAQTRALESEGIVHLPSRYDDGPYPVTKALLDDGQKLRLLDRPIHITCPVRLFHAMADPDVSWERSVAVAKALVGNDVRLELSKVGDHRLSSEEDLRRLDACLGEMADRLLQLP
ncbi:MAG: alpha/beta fold hydrolase, partial [Chromatiales bacterium]|nr:alpha/beta fold hydrolase [Chromatiales bacterium]